MSKTKPAHDCMNKCTMAFKKDVAVFINISKTQRSHKNYQEEKAETDLLHMNMLTTWLS